jgi:hypothetical protein
LVYRKIHPAAKSINPGKAAFARGTDFSIVEQKTNMERSNNNENRIPENDPSKAMDSKREVERSPDEKTDQDFPGYPHYPAKEDMMDQRTDSHRVDMDVEHLAAGPNGSGINQRFADQQEHGGSRPAKTDESDDLAALDATEPEIGKPQNVSNEDLDRESGQEETPRS